MDLRHWISSPWMGLLAFVTDAPAATVPIQIATLACPIPGRAVRPNAPCAPLEVDVSADRAGHKNTSKRMKKKPDRCLPGKKQVSSEGRACSGLLHPLLQVWSSTPSASPPRLLITKLAQPFFNVGGSLLNLLVQFAQLAQFFQVSSNLCSFSCSPSVSMGNVPAAHEAHTKRSPAAHETHAPRT